MRKRHLVLIPPLKTLARESRGFAKKALSDYKLDIIGLCEFACIYCSSNHGPYLGFRKISFGDLTEQQLGERFLPSNDPYLTFHFEGDTVEQLEVELRQKRASFGAGKTIVYSMLTDGFSPSLVADGTTRAVLDLLLKYTSFRIRILTKNAVIGHSDWIEYFLRHRDRFVVGLSTGTIDPDWARVFEFGTSSPRARFRALSNLRYAGIATYGMLCPIFPDAVGDLDALVDAIQPEACETIWAEPVNNRNNWQEVRAGYAEDSPGWQWFTRVYQGGDFVEWSRYSTALLIALRTRAEREGWLGKLRFLQYEDDITAEYAHVFRDMRGVMFQSPAADDGQTKNPHIRAVQQTLLLPHRSVDRRAAEREAFARAFSAESCGR